MKLLYFLPAIALLLSQCSSNDDPSMDGGSLTEGNWSATMSGRDGVLGQYPDLYSNYWEFTWDVKKAQNVAVKFEGRFPYARYFSFSLYDDNTGDAVGGLNDYEIAPDKGGVNPFVNSAGRHDEFTVYVVPATATAEQVARLDCANIITMPADVSKAAIVMRHYLGEDGNGAYDEFGGVELPKITAFDLREGKPAECPEHVESNVSNMQNRVFALESDDFQDMPFYLSPVSRFYPNNSTKYLYARTRLLDDQVLHFAFIPVTVPQKVEDYDGAAARYWSICLGSAANTRSYLSVCDKEANVAPGEEKTDFAVVLKSNPKLSQIKQLIEDKNAAGNHINLFVWDSGQLDVDNKPIGNVIAVMYRNILANPDWEYSIANMLPTEYKDETGEPYQHVTDPAKQIAHIALGDYGPYGVKMSSDDFMSMLSARGK